MQQLKNDQDSVSERSSPLFPISKNKERLISLEANESLKVSCPGRGNSVQSIKRADAIISCGKNNKLYFENEVRS